MQLFCDRLVLETFREPEDAIMQTQEGLERVKHGSDPLFDESCMDIRPILTLSGAREMMMRGKLAYGEASESVDACWRRWGFGSLAIWV